MSLLPELLAANRQYAAHFFTHAADARPRRRLAVLACMDARLNPPLALGLENGDAHVIRNAGGLATSDALRSLVLSQQGLGTQEVIIIQHTDCGLLFLDNTSMRKRLEDGFGIDASHLDFLPIDDLEQSVRDTVLAIRSFPFVPRVATISGLIFDVKTGLLHLVEQSPGILAVDGILEAAGLSS